MRKPAFCICEKQIHRSAVLVHKLISTFDYLSFLCSKFHASSWTIKMYSFASDLCHTWSDTLKTVFLETRLVQRIRVLRDTKTSEVMSKPAFCICKNKGADERS